VAALLQSKGLFGCKNLGPLASLAGWRLACIGHLASCATALLATVRTPQMREAQLVTCGCSNTV
jgi:hypothetical protein